MCVCRLFFDEAAVFFAKASLITFAKYAID